MLGNTQSVFASHHTYQSSERHLTNQQIRRLLKSSNLLERQGSRSIASSLLRRQLYLTKRIHPASPSSSVSRTITNASTLVGYPNPTRPRTRRGADEPNEEFKNAKNSQPARNQSIDRRTHLVAPRHPHRITVCAAPTRTMHNTHTSTSSSVTRFDSRVHADTNTLVGRACPLCIFKK